MDDGFILWNLYFFQEENDVGEFLMILEKDPQQEDFLQGRMLGNPYSSNEPGLGPLMRDVKNKICQGTVYSEKTAFVLTYMYFFIHVLTYFMYIFISQIVSWLLCWKMTQEWK